MIWLTMTSDNDFEKELKLITAKLLSFVLAHILSLVILWSMFFLMK